MRTGLTAAVVVIFLLRSRCCRSRQRIYNNGSESTAEELNLFRMSDGDILQINFRRSIARLCLFVCRAFPTRLPTASSGTAHAQPAR